MLAMWCWLQPFGQPDIFTWMRFVSGSVICIEARRSWTAWFSPIELGMPSLQRSGAGQLGGVGAGAADDVRYAVGPGAAQVDLIEPLPDFVDRLVAHPAQDE